MLRIGLVNDTRATGNPGCIAVYQAIESLVSESGGMIAASLPVNYWAEPFKAIAATSKDCVTRRMDDFPTGTKQAPAIDEIAWEAIGNELASSDSTLVEFTRSCDVIVVNGEGSIHHNYPRGLGLLALVKIIGDRRLPILLVNSTIQAMQPEVLKSALAATSFLHVREDSTRDFMASLGISSRSAVDLAFRSIAMLPLDDKEADDNDGCLVTAGVLPREGTMRAVFGNVRSIGLEPTYLCIGDGGERALVDGVCRKEGVAVVQARDFGLADLLQYLARFRLAISGRHHINIFLMRAKVPFIPLPSNTWKIEATLQKVRFPLLAVKQIADLPACLKLVCSDRPMFREACARSFARGVEDVHRLSGDMLKWMC